MNTEVDVLEDSLKKISPELLEILLKDHSSESCHIIWATSDYKHLGEIYAAKSIITPDLITGVNGNLIQPRIVKAKTIQADRTRKMAEVFTPSWLCNAQNNLIDEAWFGRKNVFNTEFIDENGKHCWRTTEEKIVFPDGKSWKDYVKDTRLEITCGEAPYLVSRYDTTTGETIPTYARIGMLDRKLRVINENVTNTNQESEWLEWVQEAYKSTYGYEFQGDNLLLARENLLVTFGEYFKERFDKEPKLQSLLEIAEIISWNLWQMDGLKGVVPFSCYEEESKHKEVHVEELFGESQTITPPKKICQGCKENNIHKHNGKPCYIRDWSQPEEKQRITFISIMNTLNC